MAGISSSKVIVSINKDPQAQIFKVSHLGIVGDLTSVIPAFIKEYKKVSIS
jgi:electron transfer flavoprotein alpha subunit